MRVGIHAWSLVLAIAIPGDEPEDAGNTQQRHPSMKLACMQTRQPPKSIFAFLPSLPLPEQHCVQPLAPAGSTREASQQPHDGAANPRGWQAPAQRFRSNPTTKRTGCVLVQGKVQAPLVLRQILIHPGYPIVQRAASERQSTKRIGSVIGLEPSFSDTCLRQPQSIEWQVQELGGKSKRWVRCKAWIRGSAVHSKKAAHARLVTGNKSQQDSVHGMHDGEPESRGTQAQLFAGLSSNGHSRLPQNQAMLQQIEGGEGKEGGAGHA
eukprot:1157365-Pelagomonas_calceolata.AAC.5